ncbi:CRAL/TRIO domain-containing protein [Trichodelitschia bisporula]|uniref:CRAL/TRIO domain-containing protein n=1 Tax=Trichodelitschia bisporula TaxID=703511 RepID=A0A6G1HW30_9PEZI|nr:CRAL/TRIO domain-containing protein [Trichodelitschia bisporula]
MAPELPPGRPGNLTPEQEAKLRELWQLMLKVFAVGPGSEPQTPPTVSAPEPSSPPEARKKSRFSMLRRKKEEEPESSTPSPSSSSISVAEIVGNGNGSNDKYGLGKAFQQAIANATPQELRDAFWGMVKHDHPDALLLRFLRARKWDVNASLIMAISALHWRHDDSKVDSDIMLHGELGMVKLSQSSDPVIQKEGADFMTQMRMGKSFLHGTDKDGRPVCYVRVRLHRPGEQSEASLERFTVYTIETARMFLRPPVDTATILFDMTDFGMANMDYTPVKFMIKCFEANYPESLGNVLVHKAPWIFQGIWKVIRGWLDPVVAAKVHFTNNLDDISEFIPPSAIIAELGGPNPWSYNYSEPPPEENDIMDDHPTRDRLNAERLDLAKKYEDVILEWASSESAGAVEGGSGGKVAEGGEFRKKRDEVAGLLRQNYWRLDPYIRARSVYDRTGELKSGAEVDEPGTFAHSADDVD